MAKFKEFESTIIGGDDSSQDPASDQAATADVPFVRLKPRKAQPFFGRHPWVLSQGVDEVEKRASNGDVVQLLTDKGKFIAYGILNFHSRIRVRLYSFDHSKPITDEFWKEKIEAALALRKQINYMDEEGGCRLISSEADGLSGLIVDRYGKHIVVQITALAIHVRLDMFIGFLQELLEPESISIRSESGMAKAEGIEIEPGVIAGTFPEEGIVLKENDTLFGIDLTQGQKTGYYLDQSENRAAAAKYMKDRTVLDMFSYTGGFGITAAKIGGAKEVTCVDGSGFAIKGAEKNAERNGLTNVTCVEADCFDQLKERAEAGEKYGAVILDPPKFTRTRRNIDEALKAYYFVNRQAVRLLEPGGILVTCSCSGNVTAEDFRMMLLGVAQKTGRDIQVLEQRGASPDHPVSVTCMENEYLKCYICCVR
ncbi:MAG: methyltransferase [Blastopirellula sp.]|nr:MAG: methyltransferase [Blastopirellula sp.]